MKKIMFGKKEAFVTDERLDSIAIIMDGNGRWAKKRGRPRTDGHIEGAKRVYEALETFKKIGVHYITVYAFSTENWKRPKEEVDAIMQLVYTYLEEVVIKRLKEIDDFCVRFIGDISALPEKLQKKCREVESMAKDKPFVCNVALNYGGRAEILHAVNEAHKNGEAALDEKTLSKYLYTSGTPDPDLIIRTGGDMRISNFLLWQCAYSELLILDTLWPDFTENEIMMSVKEFYSRKRRYGGLDKEEQ